MAAMPARPHRPGCTPRLAPRSPGFVPLVLGPLAARAAAGTPTPALAAELYEGWVHPWALQQAERQAARLPAHADRAEVTSQVLRLAWDACTRVDWARLESWPAFLERKVRSARTEAARVDDWVGRRERAYRRRYQRTVAGLEQARGRSSTPAERDAAARDSSPASGRVDWAALLVASRHPAVVAEVPDVAQADDVAAVVEERMTCAERAALVDQWLVALGAEDGRLASDLRRWSADDDGRPPVLPARLARRVAPFAPLLAGLVLGT